MGLKTQRGVEILLTLIAVVCFCAALLIFTDHLHGDIVTGFAWITGGWIALSLRLL